MYAKKKLQVIIEMSEEEHEYQQLVTYHKVCWLSLNDCVQRFTDLLPEIVYYFEQEAQNTTNRPSERAKLQEIHDAVIDPEFQFVSLLSPRSPINLSQHQHSTSKEQSRPFHIIPENSYFQECIP